MPLGYLWNEGNNALENRKEQKLRRDRCCVYWTPVWPLEQHGSEWVRIWPGNDRELRAKLQTAPRNTIPSVIRWRGHEQSSKQTTFEPSPWTPAKDHRKGYSASSPCQETPNEDLRPAPSQGRVKDSSPLGRGERLSVMGYCHTFLSTWLDGQKEMLSQSERLYGERWWGHSVMPATNLCNLRVLIFHQY